ncbi:MAG TPA: hypothetical protein VGQ69_11805 [Gemmatimonadales bacterium]|nr:hypothetical protein [Gemmatimonadales bacterium]
MKPRNARVLAAFLLAAAIHVDWHLARPGHHSELSGHWAQHWLLGIPVFALLALYETRLPSRDRWRSSAVLILVGVFLGQILEPLTELWGAPWSYTFSAIRWTAFAEFMAAGLLTFLVVMAVKGPGGTELGG